MNIMTGNSLPFLFFRSTNGGRREIRWFRFHFRVSTDDGMMDSVGAFGIRESDLVSTVQCGAGQT